MNRKGKAPGEHVNTPLRLKQKQTTTKPTFGIYDTTPTTTLSRGINPRSKQLPLKVSTHWSFTKERNPAFTKLISNLLLEPEETKTQ